MSVAPPSPRPRGFAQLNGRFPRKRAFITGAGNGLGLELVLALAGDGWTVGLFDRNVERLAMVEADLFAAGLPILAYPGDVTQPDELTVAVNSFAGSHDGLDLMINNAGVAASGGIMDISVDDWRWIIDINLMGVVHGCRAAVPHLQRNGKGLMINIASAAAFAAAPGMSSYNTTKAAVLSLSETLAGELHPTGIQVSVVMPGFIKTGLLESFRGPASSRQRAHELMAASTYPAADAARDILRLAGKGQLHIALPGSMRRLWRFKRWLPGTFIRFIAAQSQRRR
jgi:NAD(P)-dependent dehydrogenase (short-subunit alcohol dehydrogenase family)